MWYLDGPKYIFYINNNDIQTKHVILVHKKIRIFLWRWWILKPTFFYFFVLISFGREFLNIKPYSNTKADFHEEKNILKGMSRTV